MIRSGTFEIRDQYFEWVRSDRIMKIVDWTVDNTDVQIIFKRGKFIYPLENCPTPGVIPNTLNIASCDNEKIKKIFNAIIVMDRAGECHFKNYDEARTFQIRYFESESLIYQKFLEEDNQYNGMEEPRYTDLSSCTII